MANTESMTDEAMASMFGIAPVGSDAAASASASARSLQRRRQRMDMPMGEKPAATVVRRSKQKPTKKKNTVLDSSPTNTTSQTRKTTSEASTDPPPILRSIVERPASSVGFPSSRLQRSSKSKFALQRSGNNSQGFPSVHQPFGTFVKKQPQKQQQQQQKSMRQSGNGANDVSDDKAKGSASIEQVSSRDADAMLAQMSASEIQQSIQELKTALDPGTVSFLQSRRKRKGTEKTATPEGSASGKVVTKPGDDPLLCQTMPDEGSVRVDEIDEERLERDEKERIANMMSSIQTYEDLDAAYEAEVGSASIPKAADWDQTCRLLRSTSTPQVLWAARTVCLRLEEDVSNRRFFRIPSPWPSEHPKTLPVSLRCLLDMSIASKASILLQTYALRALHALLQIRAPMDHFVDVVCATDSISMYQLYFLDDAVPTVPFGSLYPPLPAKAVTTANSDTAGMAYSTSSTSTTARADGEAFAKDPMWTLVTRMRFVPRISNLLQKGQLPKEAIVAACGILAMVSVRSPGAASAIANNKKLMESMLDQGLTPNSDPSYPDGTMALPMLRLLCHMSRQSRVVAKSIDLHSFAPALMGMKEGVGRDVQQWCLLLWRTLLRYGIALDLLHTMIPLSVSALASARVSDVSLAVEYMSCFACILDCVKILHLKTKSGGTQPPGLSPEDRQLLIAAKDWLFSSVKQAANLLRATEDRHEEQARYLLKAACLRLINSYVCTWVTNENESLETSLVTAVEDLGLAKSLDRVLTTEGFAQCLRPQQTGTHRKPNECVLSASAMALFLCLIGNTAPIQRLTRFEGFRDRLSELAMANMGGNWEWLECRSYAGASTMTLYSVVKFLMITYRARPASITTNSKMATLELVGKLKRGEEAIAAIIFSDDGLFMPGANREQSVLSSMFMSELCSSRISMKQLDHSFKLLRGLGGTVSGWGCFTLDSLLSEADSLGPNASDLLLPLRDTWLHQVLAGTEGSDSLKENTPDGADGQDAEAVIIACLKLLHEVDGSNSLPAKLGAKLYYILNLCLRSESSFRSDELMDLALSLLDIYTGSSATNPHFGLEMINEAFLHSRAGHRTSTESDDSTTTLLGTQTDTKAFEDFVADVCNALLEYGAQYELCIRCVRIFLRPEFPSSTRLFAITRLRPILSLLTLESEKDSTAMVALLRDFVRTAGGQPVSSELLSLVADTLKTDPNLEPSKESNLYFLLAISMLSRSILDSKSTASQRRLIGCPTSTVDAVLDVVSALSGDGRLQDVSSLLISSSRKAADRGEDSTKCTREALVLALQRWGVDIP